MISRRALFARALRHPSDGAALVRAGWRLRARHWWKRAPFLPLPPRAYWDFRIATALGDTPGTFSVNEVVRAAKWSLLQGTGR